LNQPFCLVTWVVSSYLFRYCLYLCAALLHCWSSVMWVFVCLIEFFKPRLLDPLSFSLSISPALVSRIAPTPSPTISLSLFLSLFSGTSLAYSFLSDSLACVSS
jgi:hypothetical protein